MLPGLHVAVTLVGTFLIVASGEDLSADQCALPYGNFPNPYDCASYIRCSNGEPEVESCPDGLLFNPFLWTCDYDKTGNCSSADDFDMTSAIETDDIECPTNGTNLYTISSNCSQYYFCNNGIAFLAECPSNLRMNPNKLTCDYASNVLCDITSTNDAGSETTRMIAISETNDLELDNDESIDTSVPNSESTFEEVSSAMTEHIDTSLDTFDETEAPLTVQTSTEVPNTSNDISTKENTISPKDELTMNPTTKTKEDTSTSVSVTEFTVNKQPTVITVSTEQTKEGSNDGFSEVTDNPTSVENEIVQSTIFTQPTTKYPTTTKNLSTSSNTTDPNLTVIDLTTASASSTVIPTLETDSVVDVVTSGPPLLTDSAHSTTLNSTHTSIPIDEGQSDSFDDIFTETISETKQSTPEIVTSEQLSTLTDTKMFDISTTETPTTTVSAIDSSIDVLTAESETVYPSSISTVESETLALTTKSSSYAEFTDVIKTTISDGTSTTTESEIKTSVQNTAESITESSQDMIATEISRSTPTSFTDSTENSDMPTKFVSDLDQYTSKDIFSKTEELSTISSTGKTNQFSEEDEVKSTLSDLSTGSNTREADISTTNAIRSDIPMSSLEPSVSVNNDNSTEVYVTISQTSGETIYQTDNSLETTSQSETTFINTSDTKSIISENVTETTARTENSDPGILTSETIPVNTSEVNFTDATKMTFETSLSVQTTVKSTTGPTTITSSNELSSISSANHDSVSTENTETDSEQSTFPGQRTIIEGSTTIKETTQSSVTPDKPILTSETLMSSDPSPDIETGSSDISPVSTLPTSYSQTYTDVSQEQTSAVTSENTFTPSHLSSEDQSETVLPVTIQNTVSPSTDTPRIAESTTTAKEFPEITASKPTTENKNIISNSDFVSTKESPTYTTFSGTTATEFETLQSEFTTISKENDNLQPTSAVLSSSKVNNHTESTDNTDSPLSTPVSSQTTKSKELEPDVTTVRTAFPPVSNSSDTESDIPTSIATSSPRASETEPERTASETSTTTRRKETDSTVSESNTSTEAIPTASESEPDIIVSQRSTSDAPNTSPTSDTEPYSMVSEQSTSVTPVSEWITETTKLENSSVGTTEPVSSDETETNTADLKSTYSIITSINTVTIDNSTSMSETTTDSSPAVQSNSETDLDFTKSETTTFVTSVITGSSESEPDLIVSENTSGTPYASSSSEKELDSTMTERNTSITAATSGGSITEPDITVSETTTSATPAVSQLINETTKFENSSIGTAEYVSFDESEESTGDLSSTYSIITSINTLPIDNSTSIKETTTGFTSPEIFTDETLTAQSNSETEPNFTPSKRITFVTSAIPSISESEPDFIVSETTRTSSTSEIEPESTMTQRIVSITPATSGESRTQSDITVSARTTSVTTAVSKSITETTTLENSSEDTAEPVSSDEPETNTADLSSTYSIVTSINTIPIDNSTSMRETTTESPVSERITAASPTVQSNSETEPDFTPSERTTFVTSAIPGSSEPDLIVSEKTTYRTLPASSTSEIELDSTVTGLSTSITPATSGGSRTQPDITTSERTTSVTQTVSELITKTTKSENSSVDIEEPVSSNKPETNTADLISTYSTITSIITIPSMKETTTYITAPEGTTAESLTTQSNSETEPDFTPSEITTFVTSAIPISSESEPDFIVSEKTPPGTPPTSLSSKIELESTVTEHITSLTSGTSGESRTQPDITTSERSTSVSPAVSELITETTKLENYSVDTEEPVSSDEPETNTADLTSTYSIITSSNTIPIDNSTSTKETTTDFTAPERITAESPTAQSNSETEPDFTRTTFVTSAIPSSPESDNSTSIRKTSTDSTAYEKTTVETPISNTATTEPSIWISSTKQITEIASLSDSTENTANVSDPVQPTFTSVTGVTTDHSSSEFWTSSEFDVKTISPAVLTSKADELTSQHNVEELNSTVTTESIAKSTDVSFPTESSTENQICIKPNGFYPNPSDCRTFYQCTKGVPKLSTCTENFHFNPVMKICEDPCLAMCDMNADCVTSTTEFTDTTSGMSTSVDANKTAYTENSTFVQTTPQIPYTDASTNDETADSRGTTDFSPISYFSTPTDQILSSESEPTTGKTSEETGSTKKSDIPTISVTTDQVTSEAYSKTDDFSEDYIITETITHSEAPDLISTLEITSDINNLSSTVLPIGSTTQLYTSKTPITEALSTTHNSSGDDNTTIYGSSISEATQDITFTSETEDIANSSTSQSSTSQLTTKSSAVTEVETHSESDASSIDLSTSPYSTDKHSDLSSYTSALTTRSSCENPEDCPSSVQDPSTHVPLTLCHRIDFLPGNKCNEFINCTESIQVKKKCPTGLYFNPTTRVCDWPYSSGCGEISKPLYRPDEYFDCPCKTCLIPSSENCQFYYLCLGYTAYRLKCSGNLLFDSNLNTCTYAFRVDCPVSTSSMYSSTSSTYSSTSSSTKKLTTASTTRKSTISSTTSTRKPTTSSTSKPIYFTCPTADGLFKDPDNCGKFYQCSNRRPYKMSCPASLHFSEITQRCEYPCDARCDLTLRCGVSAKSPNDPRCPCHNCKQPAPETCTKYIECTKGKYKLVSCPRGQTFDVKRSSCDWAHRVHCQHSTLCPKPNGMFPHEDCHKFVHCSNGIPYIKNCGHNLEFDSARQRCEWPAGRCSASPIAEEFEIFQAKEHREGWICPKRFGYFVDEHHCDKFYFCSYETPQLKECSEGLVYNPRHQNCDWKKHVRCESNRHFKHKRCRHYDRHVTCPADRAPLSHDRCDMYYDCSTGAACTKQCPTGLYFNKATGICDLPGNVNCIHSSRNEEYSLKNFAARCRSNDMKKIADPTNKACFYHCRHGKMISGCCRKGHFYDVHSDKCERT